jgi:hypothetical protein
LLKADEVEGRDGDQRGKQNDGGHVLDHAGPVILGISARPLVSRQIEQRINIPPGTIGGARMMSIGLLTQTELQNLAAAIVLPLWLAARHRTPKRRLSF